MHQQHTERARLARDQQKRLTALGGGFRIIDLLVAWLGELQTVPIICDQLVIESQPCERLRSHRLGALERFLDRVGDTAYGRSLVSVNLDEVLQAHLVESVLGA